MIVGSFVFSFALNLGTKSTRFGCSSLPIRSIRKVLLLGSSPLFFNFRTQRLDAVDSGADDPVALTHIIKEGSDPVIGLLFIPRRALKFIDGAGDVGAETLFAVVVEQGYKCREHETVDRFGRILVTSFMFDIWSINLPTS